MLWRQKVCAVQLRPFEETFQFYISVLFYLEFVICYVISAMLYGSKAWCLREKEMAILRRAKRAMCGVKLLDRKTVRVDGHVEHKGVFK